MKNFNEVYTEICIENYNESKKLREKYLKRNFLIITVFILVSIPIAINFSLIFAIAFDLIVTLVVLFCPYFNTYSQDYKASIISSLVKNYDKNLTFSIQGGIPRAYYNKADFRDYTEYHASDYIHGTLSNNIEFQMCDLHTIYVYKNENGQLRRITTFKGLFSAIDLTSFIPGTVKISPDTFVEENDPTQINMDSREFEKYFNVYSEDKLLAMQVVTSELMDFLLTSRKESNIKAEITIKRNCLFVRIKCSNMFEGSMFKNPLDFNTLHKYYRHINFVLELNSKLNAILENKELYKK